MTLGHDESDLHYHFGWHLKLAWYYGIGHAECCNRYLSWILILYIMLCFMIGLSLVTIRMKRFEIGFVKNMLVSRNEETFGMRFHFFFPKGLFLLSNQALPQKIFCGQAQSHNVSRHYIFEQLTVQQCTPITQFF